MCVLLFHIINPFYFLLIVCHRCSREEENIKTSFPPSAVTSLKRWQWLRERERRNSVSLIPSISFISAGGWGRLRLQQLGWKCDLAGLSVISGAAILALLFGLGYNVMWCPGPQGPRCCCYQPCWLKPALSSQPRSECPHTSPLISIQFSLLIPHDVSAWRLAVSQTNSGQKPRMATPAHPLLLGRYTQMFKRLMKQENRNAKQY